MHEDVAGDVGRVGGAGCAGCAEWTLRDPPVLGSGEHGAPVLELVHVARGLVAQDLDRVLIAEVIRALDRVVGVGLWVVLGRVAERRVDSPFGRAGVASDRMDLGEKRDVGACIVRLDRRAHSRAAGAHDQDVVLGFHYLGSYTNQG